TRLKSKEKAPPPAYLPPKRFVRPEQKNSVPSRPVPEKAGQPVNPAVSTASANPVGTPAPLPSNPPQAPPALPTPAATLRPNFAPAVLPEPAGLQPSVTPLTAPEPTQSIPAENIFSPKQADRKRRDTAPAAQEEKRKQRQAEHKQKMQERRGKKPSRPEI